MTGKLMVCVQGGANTIDGETELEYGKIYLCSESAGGKHYIVNGYDWLTWAKSRFIELDKILRED